MTKRVLFLVPTAFLYVKKSHSYNYFKSIISGFSKISAGLQTLNPFALKYAPVVIEDYADLIEFDYLRKITKYNIKNPLIHKILKVYYRAVARVYCAKYTNILQDYDAVAIWNGFTANMQGVIKAAKNLNKPVLFFEHGTLPNTVLLDGNGVNFFNSVPRYRAIFDAYPNSSPPSITITQRNFRLGKQVQESNKMLPREYIFVPFQVALDSQIILPSLSPFIRDMEDLFNIIEKLANKFQIHFVFKEHPSCPRNYRHLHKIAQNNPFLHFANTIKTTDLINGSRGVITVNSSVGLEAIILHKKVVVLGNAFYYFADNPSVRQALNYADLLNILQEWNGWNLDTDFNNRFINFLAENSFISGSDQATDNIHKKLIENKICILLD